MPASPSSSPAEEVAVVRRGFRLIVRMARANPLPFLASVIGASVFAIGLVVSSAVIGSVTDEVIIPAFESGSASRRDIFLAGLTIIGVVGLRSLGVIARRYFGSMTGRRWQAQTRVAVTDQFLDVPLAYHRRHPTGELLARADNDVEIAGEVMMPVPLSLSVVVLIVAAAISLFLIDPILAVVGLVLFPSLAVLNQIFSTRIEAPASEVQRRLGVVSGIAHESFDGALVVKTLGREQAEVERLRESSSALREVRLQVGRLRAFFWPTLDLIPELGTIGLVLIGAWRVSAGAVTTGELVQAVTLFGMLAFPMRVLGFLFGALPTAAVAADRIDSVLREPTGPRVDENAASAACGFASGPLDVVLDEVWFSYDEGQPILRGVDLEVRPGETVALVGSTGSGKSTLCQLLLRLADPDRGSVRLGGRDLRAHVSDEIGRRAAIVFQESFLFGSTIRENITLGMHQFSDGTDPLQHQERGPREGPKPHARHRPAEVLSHDRVVAAATAANAHEFISAAADGYETVVGERGVTLSGGQRQRVALARALAREPSLLVLDDATSAVDPVIEAEILQGLRARDTTMVIVAHRLSTITLADRVLFLDDGRIAAQGRHEDLLEVPAYAALARAYEVAEAHHGPVPT